MLKMLVLGKVRQEEPERKSAQGIQEKKERFNNLAFNA
jgi:hypothetical protein